MVVFTCNHCGESLQKPRVEKHYNVACHNSKFLTCVDCLKDFKDEEYVEHTKCVTEEQRYSGKNVVIKAKKGEVKQQSWMETIRSIITKENELPAHYIRLLNIISNFDNVPRKKNRFINYFRNSRSTNIKIQDIEYLWDVIDKHMQLVQDTPKNEEEPAQSNGDAVEDTEKINDADAEPPKKKRRSSKKNNKNINEDEEPNVTENNESELKRKMKKNKLNNVNPEENGVVLDESVVNEEETSNSIENKESEPQKKKKNKSKNVTSEENSALLDESVVNEKEKSNGIENNIELKTKKKNKKSINVKSGENGAIQEIKQSNNVEISTNGEEKKKSNGVGIDENTEFSFEDTILEQFKGTDRISLKKLEKKTMAIYANVAEVTEKTRKKFHKKLKKMTNLQIENDSVIKI